MGVCWLLTVQSFDEYVLGYLGIYSVPPSCFLFMGLEASISGFWLLVLECNSISTSGYLKQVFKARMSSDNHAPDDVFLMTKSVGV